MNQPPHDSEKSSDSPHPRINQHSSGDALGGQQAAIGNNIKQSQDNSIKFNNCNFYSYSELQDEDIEPLNLQGKILSYFGVFIVLVLTLIFWLFFGLLTSFPFPYRQAIELIYSCFNGKLGVKVNRLQKQLQLENIDFQSIDRLNEIDFQARLYLRTLEHLGANKVESRERLAKTIEALKQKRCRLQDEIKPRQPKKYRNITRIQDFFESITLSQTEKDLIQIESILDKVVLSLRKSYPSETIVQDAIDQLFKENTRKIDRISPSNIGILYRIEALLNEVSDKDLANLDEAELKELNKEIVSELNKKKNKKMFYLATLIDYLMRIMWPNRELRG